MTPSPHASSLSLADDPALVGGDLHADPAGALRGFVDQVRDLVEAVRDRRPPTIVGNDGLIAVAMATGAIRSRREDTVVRL